MARRAWVETEAGGLWLVNRGTSESPPGRGLGRAKEPDAVDVRSTRECPVCGRWYIPKSWELRRLSEDAGLPSCPGQV